MPIRMVEDENEDSQNNKPQNSNNQRNTGSGGGGFNIIGMLLPILMKNPKLMIAVIAIGAIVYLSGGSGLIQNVMQSNQCLMKLKFLNHFLTKEIHCPKE
jgi:hypothetical protein